MTRYEMIRMLVLNEIADDYEEPAHIQERVSELGLKCGLPVDAADVHRALVDLVRIGWPRPYDLWTEHRREVQAVPKLEQITEYYYWITREGCEALSAFEGWPFDEQGTLVAGWQAPAN